MICKRSSQTSRTNRNHEGRCGKATAQLVLCDGEVDPNAPAANDDQHAAEDEKPASLVVAPSFPIPAQAVLTVVCAGYAQGESAGGNHPCRQGEAIAHLVLRKAIVYPDSAASQNGREAKQYEDPAGFYDWRSRIRGTARLRFGLRGFCAQVRSRDG